MARKTSRRTRAAAPDKPVARPHMRPGPTVSRAPRPRQTWLIWLLAARPKTLPAALAPVILGTALAIRDGAFAFGPALAAALCALLLQIASNYANDYFDHTRGADTPDRTGPARATANGWVTPVQMRTATALVLALAVVVGLYLVWVGGWPILVAGVIAVIAALAYSGGPLPYGYRGLGDIFVFIFFGLVAVNGTYFLQTQTITLLSVMLSICMGALATAILVVNNLRDLETDRRNGKRTLAVILGEKGARIEYLVLMLIAYLGAILVWQLAGGAIFLLLPVISIPLALRHIQEIWSDRKSNLNDTLAGTARVGLFFSLLMSAGLLLSMTAPAV